MKKEEWDQMNLETKFNSKLCQLGENEELWEAMIPWRTAAAGGSEWRERE